MRKRESFRGAGSVATVWVIAIGAVWLVWQALSGWPAFQEDVDMVPLGEEAVIAAPDDPELRSAWTEAWNDPETPDPRTGAVEAADRVVPTDDQDPSDVPEASTGMELPYSVLVGSYVNMTDAAERRDELIDAGELAFVAPTVIAGRGRYYRVFAGAVADREEAGALMRRLVESGNKERDRTWDMRPVRLAFALGTFGSEEEAAAARDRLHQSGLPAYVLSVEAGGAVRFQLYSGAFESEAAAVALDSILQEAGSTAALEPRRGRTR